MHYHAWAFAIDPKIPSIIAPEGITIGQSEFLTDVSIKNAVLKKGGDLNKFHSFVNILSIQIDAYEVNTRYNCTAFL